MIKVFSGIFLILHGLVHVWYVLLSFNLVSYQPDMGWTGKSWLLSSLISDKIVNPIAGILFAGAALLFVASGIGVLTDMNGIRTLLLISGIVSTTVLIVFWDGQLSMLVQKGIIGVILNLVIIFVVLRFL